LVRDGTGSCTTVTCTAAVAVSDCDSLVGFGEEEAAGGLAGWLQWLAEVACDGETLPCVPSKLPL